MSASPAYLALADGSVFRGEAFGAPTSGEGEVVFHTSMTGYQEILTDPSYAGQIVCMTYPEIGNVGTNPDDEESRGLFLKGFVVRDHIDFPSSWRAHESLDCYLRRHGIPGLTGVDTRALVRRIRTSGALNGVLVHGEADPDELRKRAGAVPSMAGRNLVDEVTCEAPYRWTEGPLPAWNGRASVGPRYHVVAYDFGIKRNILRELVASGFDVTVVPAATPADEALALEPDGIFLSNGPGDPAAVSYAAPIVREFIGRKPVFVPVRPSRRRRKVSVPEKGFPAVRVENFFSAGEMRTIQSFIHSLSEHRGEPYSYRNKRPLLGDMILSRGADGWYRFKPGSNEEWVQNTADISDARIAVLRQAALRTMLRLLNTELKAHPQLAALLGDEIKFSWGFQR